MSALVDFFKRFVGQPEDHEAEKKDPKKATVQAPEFDITQYAKKFGVFVGVLFPAILGVLKAATVDISTPILVAALGVTAAALLGVSLAIAADIFGRVYADRSSKWGPTAAERNGGPSSQSIMVWLADGGGSRGCPVITINRDDSGTSYLVLRGSTSTKKVEGKEIEVFDNKPVWVSESEITAVAVDGYSTAAPEAVAGRSDGA